MTADKPRSQSIRDHLKSGPQTLEQARTALGLTPKQAASTLGDLCRLGYVVSEGQVRAKIYSLTTKVNRKLSQEERTLRARERKRVKRRAEGRMTRAEYLAQVSAKAEARKAEKLAQKQATTDARKEQRRKLAEARRQQREALKSEERRQVSARKASQQNREQRAANKLNPTLAAMAKQAERRSAKETPSLQKREAQRKPPAMTSDDFIRQGGKIERIAFGEVSEAGRLKRIGGEGHRALNRESWARRVEV